MADQSHEAVQCEGEISRILEAASHMISTPSLKLYRYTNAWNQDTPYIVIRSHDKRNTRALIYCSYIIIILHCIDNANAR